MGRRARTESPQPTYKPKEYDMTLLGPYLDRSNRLRAILASAVSHRVILTQIGEGFRDELAGAFSRNGFNPEDFSYQRLRKVIEGPHGPDYLSRRILGTAIASIHEQVLEQAFSTMGARILTQIYGHGAGLLVYGYTRINHPEAHDRITLKLYRTDPVGTIPSREDLEPLNDDPRNLFPHWETVFGGKAATLGFTGHSYNYTQGIEWLNIVVNPPMEYKDEYDQVHSGSLRLLEDLVTFLPQVPESLYAQHINRDVNLAGV